MWDDASASWLPIIWIATVFSVILALLFYSMEDNIFEEKVTTGVAISFFVNVLVVVGFLVSGQVGFQILGGAYGFAIVVFLPMIERCSQKGYDKLSTIDNPMREQRFLY